MQALVGSQIKGDLTGREQRALAGQHFTVPNGKKVKLQNWSLQFDTSPPLPPRISSLCKVRELNTQLGPVHVHVMLLTFKPYAKLLRSKPLEGGLGGSVG